MDKRNRVLAEVCRSLGLPGALVILRLDRSAQAAAAQLLKSVTTAEVGADGRSAELLDLASRCPNLATLRVPKEQAFREHHAAAVAAVLDGCPRLRAYSGWLTPAILALARAPQLRLERLFFETRALRELSAVLRRCPRAEELVLRLAEGGESARSAAGIVADVTAALPRLRRLSLRGLALAPEEVEQLGRCAWLTHLEVIGGAVDDAAVGALTRELCALTHLGLCGNVLGAGAVALAAAQCPLLASLDIMAAGCDASEKTLRRLCARGTLAALRRLYVREWPAAWTALLQQARPEVRVVDFAAWRAAVAK